MGRKWIHGMPPSRHRKKRKLNFKKSERTRNSSSLNDVEACKDTLPKMELFDEDIVISDFEACRGTSPKKDLFDPDIDVNDGISSKRDLPKSKPGPASSKKKRRNAFVDTEDDSDASSEEERQPIRVRRHWGKKADTTESSPPSNTSIPAVQDLFDTILPVEEVNLPEEEPSIMVYNSQTGNVERIDHTYSQNVLPITFNPRGPSDKGIRLKNSRDLLQPPTMKQMKDRLNEISREFQVKGPLLDTPHFRAVMEKIQNTLDSMSREEIISFCKMKIEEEVMWKAEKMEREKQLDHLEASLLASRAELIAVKNKNTELKYAVSTIYEEYKRETSNKVPSLPKSLLKDPVRKGPKKPPIKNPPVQLNKRPHNFILPNNPPENNSEFITGDVKTEYPEVAILPLPETIPTIKQEQLTCTQNGVPPPSVNPTHYLVISPSNSSDIPPPATVMRGNNQYQHKQQPFITSTANPTTHCINPPIERSQIQNDSLDIEDRIPHALITCKSVQNIPAIATSTSSKSKTQSSTPQPPSTNNVEVFKVLQSIDLTHEQRISKQKATQKTISNDLITTSNDFITTDNCFPRIVSTQSLAPQPKAVCEPVKALHNMTANLPVSNTKHQYQTPNLPVSNAKHQYQTPNLPVSNTKHQYQAPNLPVSNTKHQYQTPNLPVSNNTEIPLLQNSSQLLIPSSFSSNLLNSNGQTILNGANPMQIAYIVNGAPGSQGPQQMYFTLQPQTLQGSTVTHPQNNTYFCHSTSSVTSEMTMMIPHISGVTSLGKSVHGAVKHSSSTGTQVMQEVFDLTSDIPNSVLENNPLLTYNNVSGPGQAGSNLWNEDLDRKLIEVKQKIYSKKVNHHLDKVALVKISRQDKKAADSKIKPYVMKKLSKFSGSVPGSLIKKYI